MRSMTGYGKASREFNGKKFTVEIRSLNSRQLDLNLRIPSLFRELEAEVRGIASQLIQRGKADVSVSFDSGNVTTDTTVNKELAKHYYNELRSLSTELGESKSDLLSLVFRMPDIISTSSNEATKEELDLIKVLVKEAADSFDQFRKDEGKVLENDLLSRIDLIRNYLKEIEPFEQERIDNVKTRLGRSIEEQIGKDKIDNDRFEQEIIYYLEKLDITEEKTRLNTHCNYFDETAKEDASGRKLAFISQE
jgi:uncharacterized protein (TIGR00255 family)